MSEATRTTAAPKSNSITPEDDGTARKIESPVARLARLHNAESHSPAEDDGEVLERKTKKRRKVNHACVYCRRSHMTCDQGRPCSRCIKRNIGHLCHDEPRDAKKPITEGNGRGSTADTSPKQDPVNGVNDTSDDQSERVDSSMDLGVAPLPPSLTDDTTELMQESSTIGRQPQIYDASSQQLYDDWGTSFQNQFQDIHNFHPNYLFNTSEVTNEYNLLNDFLSTSLLDDGVFYPGEDTQGLLPDPSLSNIIGPLPATNNTWAMGTLSSQIGPTSRAIDGNAITRPASRVPLDKAQEKYYMTAADPAGTDTPEERMNKLLKAKYEAGLLKPFNYVKGYARLNQYMERTLHAASRQRILRQLNRFRPKFRERMQSSTDIELVMVEMWFERKLMEYDRVFASMAIPACCWRRTGDIFRGNREMAELIHVPLEQLRDGKLSIHEIFVEDSLVSYWEKFGAIAFETSQKAILTSCVLKSPASKEHPELRCCFSFTIQRDTHSIPSLIIGNFLPIRPAKS